MLGVRFLDVDFMRINFACASLTVHVIRFIEQSIPMEKLPSQPPEDRPRVDRLGRSLKDLVAFLSELHALGIDLFLHQQGLDTTTPAGKGDVSDVGRLCRVRALDNSRARPRWPTEGQA